MQLPARLTLDEAAAALRLLPADGSVRVVDASPLREFDSSALALLLHAARLARSGGPGFEVRGAPAKLGQLARLYGVDHLLGLSYDAA